MPHPIKGSAPALGEQQLGVAGEQDMYVDEMMAGHESVLAGSMVRGQLGRVGRGRRARLAAAYTVAS